ncbi:MAG: Grx4 family monothiol glutaredoxin [Alphaproteobacteria bacterium]|jgi:monothiol glutaredoxin|nr:Grx4 family monothiol glutaredoxin [Alphaproteobacteria bacterium]
MSLDEATKQRITKELTDNDVVLFMKGTPVFPMCGFSAASVQILSHLGVRFKGINVMEDPAIREGIKSFSDWPTIPQLYVKGEFAGGSDIMKEMYMSGELTQFMSEQGVELDPAA